MVRGLHRFETSLWRRTAAFAAALVLAWPFAAIWLGPCPWPLRVWGAALAILGLVQPRWGLLLVAGLTPVATPLALTIGAPFGGAQMIEAMTVPFVVGFGLRTALSPAMARAPLMLPAAGLGTLIAIGGLVQLVAEQQTSAWASDFYPALFRHLVTDYFVDPATFVSAHLALVWIAGLGLATAASIVIAESDEARRSVVNVLLVGAAAAACLALQRLVEISARTPAPWPAAMRFAITERINPHYADLNAAGSYYAMFAVAAVWLAARARAWAAILTSPVIAFGLWMSGSRTALGAAVVGVAILLARGRRWRPIPLAIGAAAVVLAALMVMVNPGRQQAGAGEAVAIRAELAKVGVRLALREPLFGLGLGGFHRASVSEIDAGLMKRFPTSARGENAHNNFVQILVELGAFGLVTFLWLIAAALRTPTGTPANAIDAVGSIGSTAFAGGVAAFLVSCLAGHPLLTPQVLIGFLLVVGTIVGLGGPMRRDLSSRRTSGTALGIALLFAAVATPWRIDRRIAALTTDGASIGVSPAGGEMDGIRYRVVQGKARYWVPGSVQAVELPLRLPEGGACDVALDVNDRRANVVRPTADKWSVAELPMGPGSARRARRLDLTVSPGDCRVLVGPLGRRD
ncbi:MAG TPA: O-antigen ligase family protein [Vicinamibacterales bacterium]|nr:O-antigen ligase family protein [Vicinamibacterales bacterium]